MARLRRWLCLPLLVGAAALTLPAAAGAASKAKVAAIGDGAPGGGIFAGPGFSAWPTAAGNGWIAFRGETTGGNTSETMVVAHMTPPRTTASVASLGQAAPSGGVFTKCKGKLKQFLGQPVVNANGDVAFMALVEQPPGSTDPATAALAPTPAGIFLLRGGQLNAVACSGQPVPGGILDLTAIVDPLADNPTGIGDRAPALNDAGDVAFLTGYVTDKGFPNGGAILLAPHGGGYTELARIDGAFDGGKFVSIGPPALNDHGLVVFHGLVTTTDPAESNGLIDGVFAVDAGGLRVLVKDGINPMPANQEILEFQDPVSVNDRGDVAFLAGPVFDLSDAASLNDQGSPAVLVWSAGVVTAVAYPGQALGPDRVTGVALGPAGASALAAPAIGPDGHVVAFVSLNAGSREAIVRWDGQTLLPLAYTGGANAAKSPSGGVFAGAASAPALDAVGGVVFLVRITGGASSEAVIYRAVDGTESPILLGEAAPTQNDGFFGGRPFTEAHLNDAGDVVFRAFVARGPSSLGIFRMRAGQLSAIVNVGDTAPLAGGPQLVDLVGEPSLNQRGDVAFAGQVGGRGRGLFIADATGIRKVVVVRDPAPGIPGTQFAALGTPEVNDAGAVAFRGTTVYRDPTGLSTKQEGIFLADASGIRELLNIDDPSPAGLPYFTLRDPLVTDVPTVVFRAPLGASQVQSNGIFVAGATGTSALASQLEPLGDGTVLTGFTGDPAVTGDGRVAFLATRSAPASPGGPPARDLGPAIMAGDGTGFRLVVARNMPGPAGGTFRNLGTPAINGAGHVAFFGSFNPLTGGTPGVYLDGGSGLVPYVLRGEVSSIGGRLSTIGSHVALNADDDVAFTAKVSGGKARSAIFLASPTTLTPRLLTLRLSRGRGRDRVAIRATLALGRVSDGVLPPKEAVVVSLADASGTIWSAAVPARRLAGGGHVWAYRPKHRSDLAKHLSAIRVAVGKDRTVRVTALSAAEDLTRGGLRPLVPPFYIGVEVGDDAGRAAVPCALGRRGGRCA